MGAKKKAVRKTSTKAKAGAPSVAPKPKAKEPKAFVVIEQMETKGLHVVIDGISPLICHRFTEKSRKEIRDKLVFGNKQRSRELRDPEKETHDAMYLFADGRYGFPAHNLKNAMTYVAHNKRVGIDKVVIRQAVFVKGDGPDQLVELITPGHKMREDLVGVGISGKDLRWRPEFSEWCMSLDIEYDTQLINEENIVSLLNRAGFSCGIGEWRPSSTKPGNFGRFRVRES